MTERVLGTDVSLFNGLVYWPGAKADGVVHAGIRWGQRDGRNGYADPRRLENWLGAKAVAIDRYGYWVWDERAGHGAAAHMAGVVTCSLTYDGELPFVVDVELLPLRWDELHSFLIRVESWAGRRPIIYTGSWYYDIVDPLPAWLEQYEHWLTGYNDDGPSVWGPLADLDIAVVNWQQSNAWQVGWCERGAADRDYWIDDYAGHIGGEMGDKVVRTEDLRAWLAGNEFEVDPPAPPPVPSDALWLAWPCDPPKTLTQRYGINRQHYAQFGLPGHEGIDFRALTGSPIFAAAPGVVSRVEPAAGSGAYGVHVRVKHTLGLEVYETVYGHCQVASLRVALGEAVERGQVVGLADNTGNSSGPHLHMTLKHYGKGSPWMNKSDIVNPTAYMPDLFPGNGWIVDIAGNLREQPNDQAPIIRLLAANTLLQALAFGGEGGDWWKVKFGTQEGWFWEPGYKLRAVA